MIGEIVGFYATSIVVRILTLTGVTQTLIPTIFSSSLGITPDRSGDTPWLKFSYALTVSESENAIGELNLILNDSLEIIDENWLIDIHSPYVISV
jgi:hypothetical protein